LSRAQNRWRFSRPTRKIIDILNYKAPLQRLLQPRLTSQVSGQRDCCQCGVKLAEGDSAIRRVLYVVCPQCQAYQSYQKDADFIQQCSNTLCGCTWRAHEALVEQEFVCPACKKPPMIARYNTAIVVAQRTLQQLVLHYQRVLALKARTTNSGASTAGRVA
jgi:hypothetical protein